VFEVIEEMWMVLVGGLQGQTTWVSDCYLCKDIYPLPVTLVIFSTVLMISVFRT